MISSALHIAPTADRQRRGRARHSQLLHTLLDWASKPSLAVTLVAVDALWIALSIVAGFPERLEAVFHTIVDAITLGLVFVIQHTQAREQAATQRKLDEILHALPDAENSLIALEEGSDDELRDAAARHHHARQQATAGIPTGRQERSQPATAPR